jgi:hypothetical protein
MALDTNIVGSNLDASGNLKVALPNTAAQVGSVRIMSENDAGDVTGTPYLKSPETSPDYRLRVGVDTVMFTDTFNATTQNTSLWAYTLATLTCTQPGGYLQFGTVQGTAATHGAFVRTFQYFPVVGTAPLSVEFTGGVFTASPVANEIFLAGLGLPSAAGTAPTDGVYWKLTSAGLIGEIMYNGVATQTGTLMESIPLASMSKFVLVLGEREVEFWVDDVLLGELEVPAANGQPFMAGSLPVFMQKYCTGVVASTCVIRVTDVTVTLLDAATSKPWSHQVAGMGQHALFGQNGHTQGKTTVWANNTAPTAVGTLGTGVDLNFDTPICVRPGEFVDIVARNLGVVTTTGAITVVASVGGYWE